MEITLDYLRYQMQFAGYEKVEVIQNSNMTFDTYYFWDGVPAEGKYVYLVTAEKISQISSVLASQYPFLLCVESDPSDPSGCDVSSFTNALILRGTVDTCGLINFLNRLFADFNEWNHLLESHDPDLLASVFKVTWNIFHIPVVLIDNNFNTIAIADNNNSNYRRQVISAPNPTSLNEDLFLQSDYQESIERDDVFIQKDETFGQILLNKNLKLGGHQYYRLTAEISDFETDPVVRQLFTYMSDQLMNAFTPSYYQNMGLKHPKKNIAFHRCIQTLMNGEEPDSLAPLLQYGWKDNHNYSVAVFELSDNHYNQASNEFILDLINNICYDCYGWIESDNHIICVRNMTREEHNWEIFHRNIVYVHREYLLKAGYSRIFSGLRNLNLYRRQAFEALSIGKKTDPTYWYYLFDNYQLEHLLSSPYPSKDVCSKHLFTLKEVDAEKGSDLYQTLKIYLYHNCDAQKASEQLYIHRTTLLYRIKKITELTGMDLEDPDTYLHLLISFRIMDAEESIQEKETRKAP